MMVEMEEQRRREYVDNTTVTLTLPAINPVMQDSLFFANLDHVKSLQASLFPICSKGKEYVDDTVFYELPVYLVGLTVVERKKN